MAISELELPSVAVVDVEVDTDTDRLKRLLRKDLRLAAQSLTTEEVRYLVDTYYAIQDFRIQANNQVSALTRSNEPHMGIGYAREQMLAVEKDIAAMLDSFTRNESTGICAWAREITGIGPVISAGLLANIDIAVAVTPSQIFAFAGLAPGVVWAKGEKRPWNARLKVLCWKIGESFVKVSGNKNDVYGKLYLQRKEIERERNDAGDFFYQAREKLKRFKIGTATDAYKSYSEGRLPPAHIHARAKRWAVKIFLAHWWEEARTRAGLSVAHPYPISILGHAHKIERPGA